MLHGHEFALNESHQLFQDELLRQISVLNACIPFRVRIAPCVWSEIGQLHHMANHHVCTPFGASKSLRGTLFYKPCLYAFRRPNDAVCVVPSEIDQLQHTGLYCLMLLAPLNAHDRPGTSSFWSGFTMSFLWRQFFHMSLLDGTA